jgi:hypothetical protein
MASDRTEALIARLVAVEFFRAAGTKENVPAGASQVASWKEALARSRVKNFDDVKLEARGDMTAELSNHHPDRYNGRWNELTRELRPRVIATFEPRCAEFIAKHGLSADLWNGTRWDILGACMECEYADIVEAGFYARLMDVYIAGHFPCGWTGGVYPAGHLEIF